jgi:5-methylcytosine-specific restriction endonuclease McrA
MHEPPKRRKLTKAERQTVYDKCAGHCAYCGAEITIKEMQADHVIPMEFYDAYKAVGTDIDTIENMLPTCRSCNNYKSTLTLEKFRKNIENWPDVLSNGNTTYRNAVRFGMIIPNPHKVEFYFEKISREEALKDGKTI